MTAPETRTIPRKFPREDVNQVAIPWCTTHNRMMDDELARQRWCYEAGSDEQPCVVSMGGPDHKWWVDQ